jgi:non-canonical purine NTP pyrophosphatase (RdgB/HAM1 family)
MRYSADRLTPGGGGPRGGGGGAPHAERALAALAGEADRSARYVCELVALSPEGRETRGRGSLAGRIALEPRGDEGFGFDPVFVPDGEERTVAELGDAWKAEYSHRALAAKALRRSLAASAPRQG